MAQPAPNAFADSLAPTTPARWAAWVLRIAVAVQCVGMALPMVTGQDTSSLNAYLFLEMNVPEATVGLVDRVGGYVLLLVAAVALVYPIAPVVLLASAWALGQAWAARQLGADAFPQWSIPESAARILGPVALAALCLWPGRYAVAPWRRHAAILILRIAIAATFLAHGVQAFLLHPVYIDYIITAADYVFLIDLPQATAEWLLRLIGTIDIAAATALLAMWPSSKPRPWLASLAHRGIVGAAAGFAVYQLESVRGHAPFVAFLAEQGTIWLGTPVTVAAVTVAGAALAGVMASWFVYHWRTLTIYMAIWGLATALARVIYLGFDGLDQAFIRTAHVGLPLAMFVIWDALLHVSPAADAAARQKATAGAKAGKVVSTPRPRATEIPIDAASERRPI